ncbi:epithelial sodium channel subunit gamma-2-like, partial [Saccoglossus kowalevskii]|uniref:Amiloride-sensitive sodium channel subunit gamma-2-like n=1 Tax=Saccoglossus kowalevskii TaxID=10224 RepID=A0ABM0N1J5_SACKO
FLSFSSSSDYSDVQNVLKLTKGEINKYGHQAKDFIIQCSFDGITCDYRDFHVFQNDEYGNCFTFNSGIQNGELIKNSNRPGARYGLKLTLFIEQDEYIPLYGQEAGVRVLIHPSDITPFPEDEGITVAPGLKTSIGLRQEGIQQPSTPYTNCSDNQVFDTIYGNGYTYSDLACHKTMMHIHIRQECQCVDTIHVDGTRCKITLEEQ